MLEARERLSEVTMSTIVVGFKDNAGGRRALDVAIEEARRRGAKLIVLNSLRGGKDTSPEEINESRKALRGVEDRLPEEGVDFDVQQYVRDNAASKDILLVASENDAELIVVGYHRRSATGKLLLGSTPLNVMQDADCPVLAIANS
jgi:nucleotide-binding universal stress UspA family protein